MLHFGVIQFETFSSFESWFYLVSGSTFFDNTVSYSHADQHNFIFRPGFPDELFADDDTSRTVDRRWSEYFPEGNVAMGDSGLAHLD